MRRRKNTRLTFIYWLVDTRTGVPFYCGKTVLTPKHRLLTHRYDARKGTTRVNIKVRECGEHVRIDTVEVVPVGGDWGSREKHWIAVLREQHPAEYCNTVNGGAGCPGRIPTAEQREKMSAWQQGRKLTPEHREKIRAARTGTKWKPESIAKMRATKTGYVFSAEHRANISAAKKGKPGQPHTAERRAKISTANKGKKRTLETVARMRAAPNSGRFVAR